MLIFVASANLALAIASANKNSELYYLPFIILVVLLTELWEYNFVTMDFGEVSVHAEFPRGELQGCGPDAGPGGDAAAEAGGVAGQAAHHREEEPHPGAVPGRDHTG